MAQTEYFGVKWGNLSDTNRSNVPKPQKYNVTRVLTPAESENYENLIYASLTQIAADQNATNGTNATSSGRRHLLGMMDEFGSEVTGVPGFTICFRSGTLQSPRPRCGSTITVVSIWLTRTAADASCGVLSAPRTRMPQRQSRIRIRR